MIRLSHGACTHVGQVRRDNEDAFVAIDGLYVVVTVNALATSPAEWPPIPSATT